MKNSSIKILWMFPGVVLLTLNGLAQVGGQPASRTPGQGDAKAVSKTQDAPPCTATSSPSAGNAALQAKENPHSVTLSWNASVANSTSKLDAIQGYYIYRS